jgi:TrpR-related protein YerC/YecD
MAPSVGQGHLSQKSRYKRSGRQACVDSLFCINVLARYYADTVMKPNRDPTSENGRDAALYRALCSLESLEECRNFLKDLCTPAELQALVDRWQVVVLLDQGYPYRKINELTGVSVTTIGRVARFLADGFGGYRAAIERTRQT